MKIYIAIGSNDSIHWDNIFVYDNEDNALKCATDFKCDYNYTRVVEYEVVGKEKVYSK